MKKNNDITNSKEFKEIKEQTITFIITSITKDYVYKTRDVEPFFEQIKDIVPTRYNFFIHWLRGFVQVANLDFSQAKQSYLEAFKSLDNAKEFAQQFIQQSFALLMYLDSKDEAVKIWNYGVSKNILVSLEGDFFANFSPKEQFWTQFYPNMFVDQKKSQELAIKDYTPQVDDELFDAIKKCDLKRFKVASEKVDLNKILIEDVSPLYQAIQIKQTLKKGSDEYAYELAQYRTMEILENVDFHTIFSSKRDEVFMKINMAMKNTYMKSGLGKIIFFAEYCTDEQMEEKIKELDEIIAFIISKIDDPDAFKLNTASGINTTALYFAAENNDKTSVKALLSKGANPNLPCGTAPFGFSKQMNEDDDDDDDYIETDLPNTMIYRLINFMAWDTLKMYLEEFPNLATSSMTEISKKSNITPLVFLILSSEDEFEPKEEFEETQTKVNEIIQLMIKAGADLDQQTLFGTARELL